MYKRGGLVRCRPPPPRHARNEENLDERCRPKTCLVCLAEDLPFSSSEVALLTSVAMSNEIG